MPTGLPYHRLHEAGRPGWWRPVLGSFIMLFGLTVFAGLIAIIPFVVWYAVTGADLKDSLTTLVDLQNPTPAGLAYLNLALASMIPLTWLVTRVLHGLLPRWLASVRPRIRWRFLVICLAVSVVALIATLVVSAVVPGQSDDVGSKANAFTSTTRDYLLVIAFLTPLQAAGEEYLFRGYLTQAFGGLFHRAWIAVVVPAFLFGLAHGLGQSIPVFFDRFAFGLALAYGDMASTLNPSGGSWWSIPVTLTQSLVYLGLAVLVFRRMGLSTTTTRHVLEAPPSRV